MRRWNPTAGSRLKDSVRALNIPHTRLAGEIGTHPATLHRWFAGHTDPLSPHSSNRGSFEELARRLHFDNGAELVESLFVSGAQNDLGPNRLSAEARRLVATVNVHGAERVDLFTPAATAALRECAISGKVFDRHPIGFGHIVYESHLGLVAELASAPAHSVRIADTAARFLTTPSVLERIARETKLARVDGGIIALTPLAYDLVIFDWSNTLADEVELDEAICDELASRVGVKEFRGLLDELESEGDYRWFDYFYLAERCGLKAGDVVAFHERHRSRIRWTRGAEPLLRHLRRRKLALATNCARDVLALRFNLLGVTSKIFDVIVTSTDTHDGASKETAYQTILERMGIEPADAIVVSDDFDRDISAALHVGCGAVWFYRDAERQFYGSPSPPVPAAEVVRRRLLAARVLPTAIAVDHDETAALLGIA
jgi:FMN phosphatase YigB (HAD superfamily)